MQVTLQFGGRAASVPRGNSGRRDDRPVVGGCPGRAIRVPGGIGSERHGESTQRPITYRMLPFYRDTGASNMLERRRSKERESAKNRQVAYWVRIPGPIFYNAPPVISAGISGSHSPSRADHNRVLRTCQKLV